MKKTKKEDKIKTQELLLLQSQETNLLSNLSHKKRLTIKWFPNIQN